jgi:hypothetical protein
MNCNQRKYTTKEENKGVWRQMMSLIDFNFIGFQEKTSSTPTPSILHQQLADTYTESFYSIYT